MVQNLAFSQNPIWNKVEDIKYYFYPNKIFCPDENYMYLSVQQNPDSKFLISRNNGLNWTPYIIPNLRGGVNMVFVTFNKTILLSTTLSRIFRSTDNGISWQMSTAIPIQVIKIVQDSKGDLFAFTIAEYSEIVYVSHDDGKTWETQGTGLWREFQESITDIEYGSDNIIYVATSKALYTSTDLGFTWKKSSLNNILVSSLVISKDGTVIAGSSTGDLFYSNDHGLSWSKSFLDYKTRIIQDIIVDKKGYLYAATGEYPPYGKLGGIFRSIDNGISWQCIGLKDTLVIAIAFNSEGRLFAVLFNQLLYSSAKFCDLEYETLKILPNYPNPFLNFTTIPYSIKIMSPIKIIIYNSLGQLINETNYEVKPAGNHNYIWDAHNFSSGVYIVTVLSNIGCVAKKILLIK